MREIRSLTGLRGVAASVVAFTHFDFAWAPIFGQLGLHTEMVDVFFCLSGFTLTLVYGGRTDVSFVNFISLRLARIYPLYLLCLGVLSLTFFRGQAQSFSGDFIRQMLMVNSWPWIGSGVNWNNPAWSVSVEFMAYVVMFPLLRSTLKAPGTSATGLAILLCYWLIGLCIQYFDWTISFNGVSRSFELKYYVEAGRALFGFLAGWLMATHVRCGAPLTSKLRKACDGISFAILTCIYLHYRYGLAADYFLYLVPLWLPSLLNEKSLTSRILASSVVYFIGLISYSIYLLHGIVRMIMENCFQVETRHGVGSMALILATATAATLVYYLYEVPARKSLRRLANAFTRQKHSDDPAAA